MNDLGINLITAIITFFLTVLGTALFRKISTLEKVSKVAYTKTEDRKISLSKSELGPIYEVFKACIPSDKSPNKQEILIEEIYYQEFEIRNMSASCIKDIFLRMENKPETLFYDLSELGNKSVNWENQKKQLLNEKGEESYPIPYINPYKTTKHVIVLRLSSYKPLDGLAIIGSQEDIVFVEKKRFNRINLFKKRQSKTLLNLFITF